MLNKRSLSFSRQGDCPQGGRAKKCKIAEGGVPSAPADLVSFPSLDSGSPSASIHRVIPPVELMRAWESILDQIDWTEVVEKAEGSEEPKIYRDVFKAIVRSYVKGLLEQEEYRKDTKIESKKRDSEESDTESENDSNKDGGGDGFQHLEDDDLSESDESGCGSEDYIDDETDDEEDSDDEGQLDED